MIPWQLVDLAPGLYVAAIALAIHFVLRRLGERVSWKIWTTIAVVLALLLGPALFAGRSFLPLDNLRGHAPFRDRAPTEPHGNALRGDLLTLIAPLQQQVRNAWSEGRWPLWNGATGAGMPLLANPQAQALQPLAAVALPFGVERGAAVSAALRVLCALLFGWLFFRRLTLGEAAAAFGGLSYALGGFVGLWLGWPLGNAAALLPLGLYTIAGVCGRGTRGDVALCLAAIAAILLGGQPESVLYALLTLAAFALVRVRYLPARTRRPALRRLAAAGALALALAAPALAPAMDLLPRTLRASDRARTDATAAAAAPGWRQSALLRWLPVVAPNALGNGRYGDPSGAVYWGATNFNEDACGFAGTLAVLAAAASLGARRRYGHERFAWLVLALALFALAPPPVVAGWLERLPLWRLSANGHHRLLMLVSWSLAWLGACAVERAVRGELSWRRLGLAGAALAILLLWGTLAHPHPEHPEALAVLRLGWLKLQLKLLIAGGLLLWAAARVRAASIVLAGLAAAELLALQTAATPLAPREIFPPPSPALAFVAAQAGRLAALDDALPANLAGLWGLRDARLYDPAAPSTCARLVRPLNGGAAPHEFRADEHPLYDSLAVRFLLTAPERAVPGDAILLYAEADAWVWERPRAPDLVTLLPRQQGDEQRLAWRTLGPQRLQIASALEAPRFLGVSILGDPGWLLLDGRSIVRTRGPLLAAPLPSGRHRLELIYRPAIFLRGLALAAFAAAGALAWLLPPPRRQVTIGRPPRIDAGFGPPIRLGAQPGLGRRIGR